MTASNASGWTEEDGRVLRRMEAHVRSIHGMLRFFRALVVAQQVLGLIVLLGFAVLFFMQAYGLR